MHLADLDFTYPSELVAVKPSAPTRVAYVPSFGAIAEFNLEQLLNKFKPGDTLVLNDSKVIPARIFSENGNEILFLRAVDARTWQTLFTARDFKVGEVLQLPGGIAMTLKEKGLPQIVEVSEPLPFTFFEKYGEMALPPYIQGARGARHSLKEDREWYQTAWAKSLGSVAAPTASLHFREKHLVKLRQNGVAIETVTLHVGAGTFLPVRASKLQEHHMHYEWCEVPAQTLAQIAETQGKGNRVWALGTTVARTLESSARGLFEQRTDGTLHGATNLFIYPPYRFQVVDALMTNFHQPKSTLFALVAAFSGLERAREVYKWAFAKKFRLFSYGDLSAWIKN